MTTVEPAWGFRPRSLSPYRVAIVRWGAGANTKGRPVVGRMRWVVVVAGVLMVGLLLAGCGGEANTAAGYATQKEAIEKYCVEKSIDIPDLVVSGEKEVSAADAGWEINYAFTPDQEGAGTFFLLHKTADGWMVVAHTQEVGWTADELKGLGAPTDIVVDPDKK